MKDRTSLNPQAWRHYPWIFGLLLSPLLYGSVNPEGQSIVAGLFGLSVLLLLGRFGQSGCFQPVSHPAWMWLALGCLVLPLVPLPVGWVEVLSPERAALARQLPIHPGLAPEWMPLSISPAATVGRLGEVALLVTCFWLARVGASQASVPRTFVLLLGGALVALAASDVWFRLNGQRLLLGLWPNTAGHGAGTFANRNHFAGWIYVAALFSLGWMLRNLWPIQSARYQPLSRPGDSSRFVRDALFLAVAVVLGLAMAISTGSRGGLGGFLAGGTVWVILLMRRSRSRTRWVVLQAVGVVVFLALLSSSGYVLDRFAGMQGDTTFKVAIWRESLRLWGRFPLFGTGWGTFETGFNHFKQFGGGNTFLHAENDYLQALVEGGAVGALILLGGLSRLVGVGFRFAWRGALAEPELLFGALAALAAFAVHALLEFVFQITANALLASALLGYVIGSRDRTLAPAVPVPVSGPRLFFNVGWAVALFGLALGHGGAFFLFERGLRARTRSECVACLTRSVRLWPWSVKRQIALARAEVQLHLDPSAPEKEPSQAMAEKVRRQLDSAMELSPFDWELRLERAWHSLAFFPNAAFSREEAWEAVKLNPLQSQIPLSFARHFAKTEPELALKFLAAAPFSSEKPHREALALAWEMTGDTSALWALTPETTPALQTLGNFAAEQRLARLAAQVARQLTNRVVAPKLAKKFSSSRP